MLMPQSMSRVMARSRIPSFRRPRVKLSTFLRQWVWPDTHSFNRSLRAVSFRKKCSDSRISGVGPQKDVLRDLGVVLSARRREQVKADAHALPRLEKLAVEVRDHLRRCPALLFGADGDGRTVLVTARHHEDAVALRSVVAGEDVGRKGGASGRA